MEKLDLLQKLFEIKKLSAAERSKMSKKEYEAYRKKAAEHAAKRPKKGDKAKAAVKKSPAKPAPKKVEEKPVEQPSVGDLLLKSKIRMGSLRTVTNKLHPSYRGALHQHLAYNDHEHEAFNADPDEYVKGWLHANRTAGAPVNPRTTISLPGRFGTQGKKSSNG